ncbi:MAG: hypothetical protein JWM86_1839 [Thermoleophilia bacterium]|nr:hypothetical protein [Thermoleophilia bacterium]
MKLFTRFGIAAVAITGAAFIAAGCGGSGGGSAASDAATNSKALDYVPKDAIGYAVFDTDFSGDNWKQFSKLAGAFDKDFEGVEQELSKEAKDSKDPVDFEKDVDPWLGKTGGAALLAVTKDGDDAEFFAWVEIDDRKKFDDFAKDRDEFKKGDKVGDFTTYTSTDDDEMVLGVSDDLAIITDSEAQLKETVEYDGDSISDVDGVDEAVDEAGDDALATIVFTGQGVRKALSSNAQLKAAANAKELKDFKAAAVSFGAEDEGMHVRAYGVSDGEKTVKNGTNEVFTDLPGDTVFAVGGTDFGGGLKTIAEEAGKDNAQIQQGVGALSGLLGVDIDDIAKAFEGDFALGLSGTDEGLGGLVGGVAGAAMGGGNLSGSDAAALAKSGAVVLAFEETGTASDTLDKIVGAAGGFIGAGGAPKSGTQGDFETKELTVAGGIPITTAASDDVAGIAIGTDVFSTWGDEGLGDNDAYKAAWKAADGPDETGGNIWVDAGRIAKLANLEGKDDVELGGLVGWVEADDSNASFDLFLHIESK